MRRPVLLKVEQEVRPVSGKAISVEVREGEREGVVDADEGHLTARHVCFRIHDNTTEVSFNRQW
jgi:hypothetical protein